MTAERVLRALRTSGGPVGTRVAAVVGGVGATVLGLVLAVRPLTALVVLVGTAAVLLVLAGITVLRRSAGSGHRGVHVVAGALLLGLSVPTILFLPAVVRLLPFLAAALLVAFAGRRIRGAFERGRRAPRFVALARSITAIAGAVLVVSWPDVATVLLAFVFALALMVLGVLLVVGALRRERPSRPLRDARRGRVAVRVVTAALALVLVGGAALGSTAVLRAERVDAFYAWDETVPATPGALLRVAPYQGAVPGGAEAVRILYATTRADGSPALASAVVAYPDGDAPGASRPVLAWQHGTTGVARECAPSAGPDVLTELAIPGIHRALERGWAVVATDYPGQGTEGRYPFLIGQGEGRATLDGIRAVRQVEDAHASADAWLWGHSQGGHATLWAGEIAEQYAPELHIRGVAALSAASDPLALAQRVTGAGSGVLSDIITAYVLVPYSEEYPDMTLGASVHAAGHGIVESFASRCATSTTSLASAAVAASLAMDAPLYRIDLEQGPARERLAQNRADGHVTAPLFLGQGTDDEVIPIAMQQDLTASLCSDGRPVSSHEYPGRTHMGVIAEGSPLIDDLFTWVDEVEAGQTPDTCGT